VLGDQGGAWTAFSALKAAYVLMRFIFNKDCRYAAVGALTVATIRAAGFGVAGGAVPDIQEPRREGLTQIAQRILIDRNVSPEQWSVIESAAAEHEPRICRIRFQSRNPELVGVCDEIRQAWELSYSVPEF
jgi:hypothetical protein